MSRQRTWRFCISLCLLGLVLFAGSPAFAQLDRETECPPSDVTVAVGARLAPSCDDISGPVDPSTGRRNPVGRQLTGAVDCREVTTEILSRVMCTVETKLTGAASMMYCGVADAIKRPLALAIILYMTIFGFTVALGITKLTFGDAVVRGIKISLVWVTATQAQYGISLLYQFFVGIVREGVRMITRFPVWGTASSTGVQGVNECPGAEGVGTFLNISELTGNLLGVGAENGGAGGMMGVLMHFILTDPGMGLIGVILFLVAAYYLAAAFLRVVMAYLLALVVIAFLVSLAPIFIMLALFNQYATFREYFDNWVNTLASHAVQPIFLFAVLFFVVAMMATNLQFMSNMSRPCANVNPTSCSITESISEDQLQLLQRADGSILTQPSSCAMYFDKIKIGVFNVLGLKDIDIAPPGYIIYYGKFDPNVINTYVEDGKCITAIDASVEGNRGKSGTEKGYIYEATPFGQGQISFCGHRSGPQGVAGAVVNSLFGGCAADFTKAFIFHMLMIIIKCGLLFAYLDSAADHIAALATRFAERLGGSSPFTLQGGTANQRMLSSNYKGALGKLTSTGKPGGGGRGMVDRMVGLGKPGVMERMKGESRGSAAKRRGKELMRAAVGRVPMVGGKINDGIDIAKDVVDDTKTLGRIISRWIKR